jgi:signal transduction histidine kinase
MRCLLSCIISCILCFATVQAQDVAMADSLFYSEEYEAAFAAYTQIIQQKKGSPIELGNSFLRRGRIFNNRQKYRLSLQDYFAALPYFEQAKNEARIAAAYNNIGDTYSQILQYNNATAYIQKSLVLYHKLNDTAGIIRQQNSLGMVQLQTADTASSKQTFLKTINDFRFVSTEPIFAKLYLNLAICYLQKKNDSASFYYQKALANASNNEDSATMAIVYNNIGDLELTNGNFKKALALFEQSDALNIVYGDSSTQAFIYHNLSLVYNTLGDAKQAYHFAAKERTYNDALYDREKNKIAAELSEKYESDKKDAEISSQQKQNKLKSRNLLLSFIALGLVAALGAFSFFSYKRKQKANQLLQQQNDHILSLNKKLDVSNQVKTKLFSIISHDLRSPVSSLFAYLQLTQQSDKKPSPQTIAAVTRQTENLLETLEDLLMWSKSQLEQFVPEYSTVSLHQSVQEALELCSSDIDSKQLKLVNEIPNGAALLTDVNMFTIIIRNIIFNAVQNAIPGTEIKAGYQSAQFHHTITIKNTTSLPEKELLLKLNAELVNSKKHGLGRILIQEFTEKLNGELEYAYNNGQLHTVLTLPIQK